MAIDFQADRFWSKVLVAGDDECWTWRGGTDKDGYGLFCVGGKTRRAHRYAFLLKNNIIPKGKLVMHTCDNPPCCNPRHLIAGTTLENVQDKMRKGRHRSGTKGRPDLVPHGSAHVNSRLSEDQVLEIRRRYIPRKVTLHQLAAEYGVSFTTIHNVLHTGWRHV